MTETVVEAKEAKETLHAEKTETTLTHAPVTKGVPTRVFLSVVIPSSPSKEPSASEEFTRETFEDALDKVSKPLRGRLAHVPYSSEDFIREKREEAELEDRPS